jgi:phosphoribosylformimino-5-aminoimidazole carboxamide ribotide isomerase
MQGDPDRVTVYGNDPGGMALRWQEEGAEWLHVVDLDGAFSRSPRNRRSIQSIVEAVDIPVQVGGGIRTLQTIVEYMDLGLRRVILGTAALRKPDLLREAAVRYPGRVALGIDARGGKVAVEGWTETTQQDAVSLVRQFEDLPLAAIIYTDIHRDGMQTGVNVEATRQLLLETGFPVIASGGVATIADIEALFPLLEIGLEGVITGRALYNGTLRLKEALACVQSHLKRSGSRP